MEHGDVTLDQRFADAMGGLLGPSFPSEIGLAVSGGGDSMAMLALAHGWARVWGVKLWVVTVDHGLRPEAADEARMVAAECAALGHEHTVLRWHWDGAGNKMDAARRGRLALIDQWRGGLEHVLMAHTRDDVAETFVMRLARGSGVDGLAAMAARRRYQAPGPVTALPADAYDGALPPQTAVRRGGFDVIRPCLGMTRAELRHYARVLHVPWAEDPSNDDPSYDRVRVRQAKEALAALGLDDVTLAQTAERMGRARDALRARAVAAWEQIGQQGRVGAAPTGELLLARDGFERLERDTQLRLLAAALQFVASAEYRPRAAPLEALLDRILGGGGGVLHGCGARMERAQIRVWREFKAVEAHVSNVGEDRLWDGRWRVLSPDLSGLVVRVLGEEGWRQVAQDRPEDAPPHHSARSLPAIWRDGVVVSCPALGLGQAGDFALNPFGREMFGFTGFLLSH